MTYEQYKEQEFYIISGAYGEPEEGELEALQAKYPEYAARAKQEADTRRGCTYEEYQEQQAAKPDVQLAHNQDGDVEYVECM